MNETQQAKTIWQVLESRDKVILKARQENARLHKITELVQELTVKLQINTAKQETLQHIIEQKDVTIEDIKNQLKLSEEDRLTLWQKIDRLQAQLNESKATIEGMESTKIWKLRNQLLKLKQLLKFKTAR